MQERRSNGSATGSLPPLVVEPPGVFFERRSPLRVIRFESACSNIEGNWFESLLLIRPLPSLGVLREFVELRLDS